MYTHVTAQKICCMPNYFRNIIVCVYFSDGWSCPCPDVYVGDTCSLVSPCLTQPCDVTGSSSCDVNTTTSRVCRCNAGFSGVDCDVGPCDADPCDDAGTRSCSHYSDGSYECECRATYEGQQCDALKGEYVYLEAQHIN